MFSLGHPDPRDIREIRNDLRLRRATDRCHQLWVIRIETGAGSQATAVRERENHEVRDSKLDALNHNSSANFFSGSSGINGLRTGLRLRRLQQISAINFVHRDRRSDGIANDGSRERVNRPGVMHKVDALNQSACFTVEVAMPRIPARQWASDQIASYSSSIHSIGALSAA